MRPTAECIRAEFLVADIGSTVTKLSAFAGLESKPRFLGQGAALTTVEQGDVAIGLDAARQELECNHRVDCDQAQWLASASAAGGLRMSVHGLTAQMTLRAAREASLGAGAIVVQTSAGKLRDEDLEQLRRQHPGVVLLAGGVDFGDIDTVLANARALATVLVDTPVVYAGNRSAASEVSKALQQAGLDVSVVDNVYPDIDRLNLEPVRARIQQVFSDRLVQAPGMEAVRQRMAGRILPTPGAVMRATELLAERLGNVLTIDVGGATTDVHSVTQDAPEHAGLRLVPEPRAKRSVEGDLGVYRNAQRIVETTQCVRIDSACIVAMPDTEAERNATISLTREACRVALSRHLGRVRPDYGVYGRSLVIEGRDLSAVAFLIGTGGALTRLGEGEVILAGLRRQGEDDAQRLLPPATAAVLVDRHYIMAACGVLAQSYPEAASHLLLQSLGLGFEESAHA